jgi:hypothetical protein
MAIHLTVNIFGGVAHLRINPKLDLTRSPPVSNGQ